MTTQIPLSDIFIDVPIYSVFQYKNGIEGSVYNVVTERGTMIVKFLGQERIKRHPATMTRQIELLPFLSNKNISAPIIYKHSILNNYLCYYCIEGDHTIPNPPELVTVAQYLKSLSLCDINELSFLPTLSKKTLFDELQSMAYTKPYHNSRLQKELMEIKIDNSHMTVSHGDYHHGNMIWSKDHKTLSLIDWDEALIAPIEYDIARFFVSHAVYSGRPSADSFLNICHELFQVTYAPLIFFIHYNAYFCLTRFRHWTNGFWGEKNNNSEQDTECLLETLFNI